MGMPIIVVYKSALVKDLWKGFSVPYGARSESKDSEIVKEELVRLVEQYTDLKIYKELTDPEDLKVLSLILKSAS